MTTENGIVTILARSLGTKRKGTKNVPCNFDLAICLRKECLAAF